MPGGRQRCVTGQHFMGEKSIPRPGKARPNPNLLDAGTNKPRDTLNLHEMGICTVYIFRNRSFLLAVLILHRQMHISYPPDLKAHSELSPCDGYPKWKSWGPQGLHGTLHLSCRMDTQPGRGGQARAWPFPSPTPEEQDRWSSAYA